MLTVGIQSCSYQYDHYIYGANGLAAICVRRNGVDSLYYVHPDRLQSYNISTINLPL